MSTALDDDDREEAEDRESVDAQPQPLPIRGKPPKATRRLNKRTVIVLSAVIAAVLLLALAQGLAPNRASQKEPPRTPPVRSPASAEALNGLPQDYTDIKPDVPKLGAPLGGELGGTVLAHRRALAAQEVSGVPHTVQLTAEQQALEAARVLTLKRAVDARSADVAFAGSVGAQISMQPIAASPTTGGQDTVTAAPRSTARDDDNRQDDKADFLNAKHKDTSILPAVLQLPVSPYELMAGTIIPGLLLTGINSDLPGQIVGQVSQNVFDTVTGQQLLIPQGTKLIGVYDSRIAYGQGRALIVWTRLILPSGASINLEGMPGVDLSGYAGLTDKVDNHYWRLLSGVVLGSFLGAAEQIAQGSNSSTNPGFAQLATQGAAQNANQAGQQLTRKDLNIQPTLEIRPGFRFNVFVTKDIVLQAYRD